MTEKTIWQDSTFSSDGWAFFAETNERSGSLVISVSEWNSGAWADYEGRLGLDVHGGDDIAALSDDLGRFDLVVVNFPAFSDGRAFSIARLIRTRFAFEGDIRARGGYILDQMPILMRCGVTSFDISSDAVRAGLERGVWPDMSGYYQHALDGTGNSARVRGADIKRPWILVNVATQDALERAAA